MDSQLRSGARVGASAGDFEAFYEAEERRLYGTICVLTGNRAVAEELMQEAFLRVWERWERVSLIDNLTGYLYRTAFNLFRSHVRSVLRAGRRHVRPDPPDDPIDRVTDREDLMAAVRMLPARQRAALVALDLMDLSSEEGGRLLGVSPVTVRSLASQARRAVRESMGVDDE